jgi:cytochrome oxidase Cu insertion factor (SCO1/SenC/PrrC family)
MVTGRHRKLHADWGLLSILSFCAVFTWVASVRADDASTPPPGLTAVSPPTPMPSFSLPALDGTTVDSTSLQGKVTVVRFWATW